MPDRVVRQGREQCIEFLHVPDGRTGSEGRAEGLFDDVGVDAVSGVGASRRRTIPLADSRRDRRSRRKGVPLDRRTPSAISPGASQWQDRRDLLPPWCIVKTLGEASPAALRKRTLAACCGTHGVQDGLTRVDLRPASDPGADLRARLRAGGHDPCRSRRRPCGCWSCPPACSRSGSGSAACWRSDCSAAGPGTSPSRWPAGSPECCSGSASRAAAPPFQHSLCSSLVSGQFEGPVRRTALGAYNASGDAGKLAFTGLATALLGARRGAGREWRSVYGAIALTPRGPACSCCCARSGPEDATPAPAGSVRCAAPIGGFRHPFGFNHPRVDRVSRHRGAGRIPGVRRLPAASEAGAGRVWPAWAWCSPLAGGHGGEARMRPAGRAHRGGAGRSSWSSC